MRDQRRNKRRSRAGTSHPRPNLRAPHLSSLLAFIPPTATALPIDLLPRQPRRASGGPPVLHGFPPAPQQHRFSLASMQQPLETNFACSPFSHTPNRTPRLFFQRLLQALALRHLLSDHRALCSSYRRHFESHPILSGEFQCFRLYDSATHAERFLPAETLEALGTHTVS